MSQIQSPEVTEIYSLESSNDEGRAPVSPDSLLMDDIDPTLLDFIKSKVDSFIKWDLARFFHENPHATGTVENIATYAGRNRSKVELELEELAKSGLLEKRALDGMSIYSLTSDEEMRALVDKFVFACEDRLFRVKAVYHIIRGMR